MSASHTPGLLWQPRKRRSSPRPMAMLAFVAAAVVAGVIAYGWHLDSSARDSDRPAAERVAAAEREAALAPWLQRARVSLAIARADALVADGRVDRAYELLLPLASEIHGDPQFRDTYQRIVAMKAPLDARKAHQQHAKEDAGGKLDESDVFK